jgi:hypothetical protein
LRAQLVAARSPALEHRRGLLLHEVEERQRVGQALAGGRVAVLIGFRPDEPVLRVVAAMALLLSFAYVVSWISAVVASRCATPRPRSRSASSGSSR